jgi:DNA polymerase III subunit beta
MDMQLDIEEHTATGAWPSFTVRVSDFHKAISIVKGAVERTTLVPILTHARIEARDGALQITATDMEVSLTKTIEVNVRVPGVMVVPAVWLADTLSRMQQDGIADVVASDRSVTIKVGKSRATVTTDDPTLYPAVNVGEFQAKIEMGASVLEGAIAHVGYCMSKETTRYYLCGIAMQAPGANTLRMAATDGTSLAEVEIQLPVEDFPSIILPTKAVALIKSCLSSDAPLVQIEVSDRLARLTFADVVMTTKLVDAIYPEYRRAIPERIAAPMIVVTKPLLQSVRLVANGSDDTRFGVAFEFSDGALRMSSRASDKGAATSELGAGDVNCDGPMAFTVNGNELSEALACLAGDAEFHFEEDRHVILLRDTKDEGFLFVLGLLRY